MSPVRTPSPRWSSLVPLVAIVAACATTNPAADVATTAVSPPPSADVVAPNEHLTGSGIPPVPRALAERVRLYTEFKPVGVVDWVPNRHALLVAYRSGATTQLHLLDRPNGTLEPLTDFPDPVSRASFEPASGDYFVYARDSGGNEAAQLYRYDFATKASTLLTDPSEKHAMGPWNHARTAMLTTATQLDRTASGGTRQTVTTDLALLDPRHPETRRKIASLEGGGWEAFRWTHGDRAILALEYRSANESVVWQIDATDGTRAQLLPSPRQRRVAGRTVSFGNLHLTRDGRRLVYTSDEDGEFQQLVVMDLATRKRRVLTRDIPWNVDDVVMQADDPSSDARGGRRELACLLVDVAGRHELRVVDLDSGRAVALPELPAAARAGSIGRVRFARSGSRDEIAFTVNSAQSPGDVYTLDLAAGRNGRVQQWTASTVDGIDAGSFRAAEIVRWKSFDGREITGLLNRPPVRFTGRRPVVVNIHGGPEGQATIGFLGRNNYLTDELGVALIQPNVRGSSGYGKTFLALDDGIRREDAVKDIGALLDWIATQPDLDPTRVLVAGGSYGGYMSLAVATHYADRIAASIDVVGISSFTTFLERTESYRRDLRRAEYGDERDPAMRAFFERISPLANADRIRKPLFVVAGRNDPRVPYQEGEQIVAKVRGNGVPVWYLVADNEGHGFARKPNADFQFYAQVLFMQQYLLP